MKFYKILILLVLFCLVGGSCGFAAGGFTEKQKSEIETIIADFLDKNPDVIMASLQAAQVKAEKDRTAKAQEKINEYSSDFKDPSLPSVGPADADVTVIEFFDYNCGYCKRAFSDVQKIVAKDKKVRFVFQEMPILSESSIEAAKWSLAAHKQGRYFEYHSALMAHQGPKNKETLKTLGEKTGLDTALLEKDSQSKEVHEAIQKSRNIAAQIGINGTPAFIVDAQLFPGYIGADALEEAIEKARKD